MVLSMRLAGKDDHDALKQLLNSTSLNDHGIEEENNYFIIAEDYSEEKKRVIAVAGIEKRSEYGFLRSLVLQSELWNGKMGLDFITNVVKYAITLNFKAIYLLTLPDLKYMFELLSFQVVSINEVPEEIKQSQHFINSYNPSVVIMKNY